MMPTVPSPLMEVWEEGAQKATIISVGTDYMIKMGHIRTCIYCVVLYMLLPTLYHYLLKMASHHR